MNGMSEFGTIKTNKNIFSCCLLSSHGKLTLCGEMTRGEREINEFHYFYLLGSDLESLRAVFNEKEKELSLAVAKVDELTRQLEDLRRSNKDQSPNGQQSVAAAELEKLRRELMVSKKVYFHVNLLLYYKIYLFSSTLHYCLKYTLYICL